MLDNLEAQIGWAVARRGVPLGNDAPTACRFDPRLPTTVMPPEQSLLRLPVQPPQELPASDEDIAFSPATSLSAWIASGRLSSRRLTEIYLARIERLGPATRVLCRGDRGPRFGGGRCRRSASRTRGQFGPLHGCPTG